MGLKSQLWPNWIASKIYWEACHTALMNIIQPFTISGRNLRMCLLPVSGVIAIFTNLLLIWLAAEIRHSTISNLLKTDSLWPLAIFFPGLIFGMALGFIAANLMCYFIPPLRRVFERECTAVGRRSFSKSMNQLSICAAIAGALAFLGMIVFLSFA